MKYRAKITQIQSWVENHYNTINHNLVRDVKDTYIEVDNEEEAEYLECMNAQQAKLIKMQIDWHVKFQN